MNITVNIMLLLNMKKVHELMGMTAYKKRFDRYFILDKIHKDDIMFLWKNIDELLDIIDYFYDQLD